MPDEARLILAFGLALAGASLATPVAIAVATRTGFHDRPVGYKRHGRPTPYLGGAAVLGGFLVAAPALGADLSRLAPIVLCACALWALGTLDDRIGLPAWPRVALEALLAVILWSSGLGWDVLPGDAADLGLTVIWVVALVNAFNLMDNMDGAAATLAAVTSVGLGVLALVEGDVALAALVFGLAGACLGFLPYNLASPSRIFLGDGGSLVLGFVVAAALMALTGGGELGAAGVLAAVLVAGLPVVDSALVLVSRRRAGISFLTGGRDHLTHRLSSRVGTARAVALMLGVVQAVLGAIAIGATQLGQGAVVIAWSLWFVAAALTIALLETRTWAPARELAPAPVRAGSGRLSPAARGWRPTVVEAALIAFISVACGLSPFLYGFYNLSVWGPIALGLLAALLGLLFARPAAPRRGALIAAGALAGMWLLALISVAWSESAFQALTDANRWLLYACLFAVLVLLLRNDRLGLLVVAAGTATIAALGGYLLVRFLGGSGSELFIGGRLNEPLGYVNGQVGYLALGLWPLIAVAERATSHVLSGIAVSLASALGSLVLLGQTRAVIPALALSAVLMLAVVPGRARRGWALLFIAGGVLAAAGPVLDVYDATRGAREPSNAVLRHAGVSILIAAAAAGATWTLAMVVLTRLRTRVHFPRRLAWVPLLLIVGTGVAVGLSAVNDPVGNIRDEYRAFTQLDTDPSRSTRLTSGGGNRYDYWRIAWHQFSDKPLQGVGAGNYDRTYFLERRTTEDVRQAHSIELQTLGELGLLGAVLLALFVGAVIWGFRRRVSAAREDPRQAALAVAAGGTFCVWLVHTSVDWLHLIPGLTGIALCSAAALVGGWSRPRGGGEGRLRIVVVMTAALLIVMGAVLVGRQALAEHYRNQGQALIARDPDGALAKARLSLALNDEALPTYYLRSAAWARRGDYRNARAALLAATRLEPHDFVPWALLGDLAARRGNGRVAARYYRRALALNPRNRSLMLLAKDPPIRAAEPR